MEKDILHIFGQLETVLQGIGAGPYKQPLAILNGATIGQHVRHALEMFICLNTGYTHGEVNYDERRRDKALEENNTAAMHELAVLRPQLDKTDKLMLLVRNDWFNSNESCIYNTSYYRELLYCMEHAIHHMALIKTGLKEAAPAFILPDGFGIAASTLKYQKHVHSNLSAA
jgi:uncharacterized damage-inducible protein DinB